MQDAKLIPPDVNEGTIIDVGAPGPHTDKDRVTLRGKCPQVYQERRMRDRA